MVFEWTNRPYFELAPSFSGAPFFMAEVICFDVIGRGGRFGWGMDGGRVCRMDDWIDRRKDWL